MTAEQNQKIEALYLEMFEKLMIYARANLESDGLAEEAVQETFRVACELPQKVCASANPQGWLVLTLRNTIRNMKRNRATARRVIEQYLMDQVKEIAVSEDHVSLHIQYENLAQTEEFKLLAEMAIEGKSHQEMAAARGISVSACKKRVQRAKETLQKKLRN